LALLSLAVPDRLAFESLIALMGLPFVLSPWVMGFTGFRSLVWTAWIVGIVALVAGAAEVQMTARSTLVQLGDQLKKVC
jgi:hypothetical protein